MSETPPAPGDGNEANAEQGDSGATARQDPFVERLRPDPAAPPTRVFTFAGLAGRSDRPGYRRLYLTRKLDRWIEVSAGDVVAEEQLAADTPPMPGLESTRWHVRRDATIDHVTSIAPRPVDEFDLDVRLGSRASGSPAPRIDDTWDGGCTIGTDCGGNETEFGITCGGTCGDTCEITVCRGRTCDTCRTDCGATCDTCARTCDGATCITCRTCNTNCNQATCQTCNQATCQTCNQATCQTCDTACNQATCRTCQTDCGHTCVTCDTCNPHVFTCGTRCA